MNKDKKIPFPILFEDNHILVVFKPAGYLSQGDHTGEVDMITFLKAWLKEKYQKPGKVYLGLVHRLDRMTSGVMVFAKTSKAASRINEQIRKLAFHKKYYALVEGKVNYDNKPIILENYLTKNEEKVISYVSDQATGKLAKLTFSLVKEIDNISLLDINLITGRHHQIRCQLSYYGHPIIGDSLYGAKDRTSMALCAYEISFKHPITQEHLVFTSYPKGGIWDKFLK